MLIGSATILPITNWKLALVALLMIPSPSSASFSLTKIGPRFRITVQQKLATLNTLVLQENLAECARGQSICNMNRMSRAVPRRQ